MGMLQEHEPPVVTAAFLFFGVQLRIQPSGTKDKSETPRKVLPCYAYCAVPAGQLLNNLKDSTSVVLTGPSSQLEPLTSEYFLIVAGLGVLVRSQNHRGSVAQHTVLLPCARS